MLFMAFQSAKGHTPVTFDCQVLLVSLRLIYSFKATNWQDVSSRGWCLLVVLSLQIVRYESQPRVGAYREGSLDGIDVYKVPASIIA